MVREGEKHAAADKQRKEVVEAVNQAESQIHDIESKVDEYKDQLKSEDVANIRKKITELREILAQKDSAKPEAVRQATSGLQQASLKLFEQAYQKMAQQRQQGGQGGADQHQQQEQKQEQPKEGEESSEKKKEGENR